MELCDISLEALILPPRQLDEKDAFSVLRDTLLALKILHRYLNVSLCNDLMDNILICSTSFYCEGMTMFTWILNLPTYLKKELAII